MSDQPIELPVEPTAAELAAGTPWDPNKPGIDDSEAALAAQAEAEAAPAETTEAPAAPVLTPEEAAAGTPWDPARQALGEQKLAEMRQSKS